MGAAAQAHALQQQQQQQQQVTPSQLQHMRNLLAERQVILPTPLQYFISKSHSAYLRYSADGMPDAATGDEFI